MLKTWRCQWLSILIVCCRVFSVNENHQSRQLKSLKNNVKKKNIYKIKRSRESEERHNNRKMKEIKRRSRRNDETQQKYATTDAGIATPATETEIETQHNSFKRKEQMNDKPKNNRNNSIKKGHLLKKVGKKRKDPPTISPGQFDDAPEVAFNPSTGSMVAPLNRSQLEHTGSTGADVDADVDADAHPFNNNINPEALRLVRQQLQQQQQRRETLEQVFSEQRKQQQPLQHESPLQRQAAAINAQLDVAVSGLRSDDPYHQQQQQQQQQLHPVALTAAVTQETINSPHALALQLRLKTQILKAHMEYNAALVAIEARNQTY